MCQSSVCPSSIPSKLSPGQWPSRTTLTVPMLSSFQWGLSNEETGGERQLGQGFIPASIPAGIASSCLRVLTALLQAAGSAGHVPSRFQEMLPSLVHPPVEVAVPGGRPALGYCTPSFP